jgi:hypothetical protein
VFQLYWGIFHNCVSMLEHSANNSFEPIRKTTLVLWADACAWGIY